MCSRGPKLSASIPHPPLISFAGNLPRKYGTAPPNTTACLLTAACQHKCLPTAAPSLLRLCRLLAELGGDPLLARVLRAQNQRLHEMAEQGLDHPSFHTD